MTERKTGSGNRNKNEKSGQLDYKRYTLQKLAKRN